MFGVRLMVGMFDQDHSGTINFNEFAQLWGYLHQWSTCFRSFDTDRSGSIDPSELEKAFLTFGYRLNPDLIRLLIRKYDRQGIGAIPLDAFIQCCVTVQTLTNSFRRFDTSGTGWINLDYHSFLNLVLSNR
ncbi:hypothetical protein H9P43_001100 [Blastocladiella emersonii ATCC 22665]|nr:hypothetical protein H9P43_001100 [Blastocladiella emersonii ATCC 22665]